MKAEGQALALIRKRFKNGDDAAAARWIEKNPTHGFRFTRTALRLFRIGERTSRHHKEIFIEAYNAVQRSRQVAKSKKKAHERDKKYPQQEP